jgi:single-stranded-DNA-specific exonuclease
MSKKKWQQKSCNQELYAILKSNHNNLCDISLNLMANRNIGIDTDSVQFLDPKLNNLRNPSLFADMSKACKRIIQAIKNNEVIGIFGDYDVDGVASVALLLDFFKLINAYAVYTLPNRLNEGYGLSKVGIERLVSMKASLIITTDCGTQSFEEIAYANSLGLDVIVIDHHNIGDTLPNALALINPKRKDCESKASILCATGVAFYVCLALRKMLVEENYLASKLQLVHLLDLVALATVCDVVPLIEDNRIFVNFGLKIIKQGLRAGLKALLEVSKVDQNKISSTNLGFHLGPRINAAGRLDDATLALQLMNDSYEKALTKAQVLQEQNLERQILEEEIVKQACAQIESDPELKNAKILVLHNESWHIGVVGIVASRISEKYHRPSIIIGEHGKGSGRSIKGIDLHAMVDQVKDFLHGFGGHFHAIGLSLKSPVKDFREALNKVVTNQIDEKVFEQVLFYDQELGLNQTNLDLIKRIKIFEPFGAHNPYPVFRINKCFIRNLRELNGGHIKGELENNSGFISFIGFRMSMDKDLVNQPIDVLGVIEENHWQQNITAQLRIIDYKISSN